jgi:hypothetical protein
MVFFFGGNSTAFQEIVYGVVLLDYKYCVLATYVKSFLLCKSLSWAACCNSGIETVRNAFRSESLYDELANISTRESYFRSEVSLYQTGVFEFL